jgi:DNA invertase Pin-like site-specific DNA recombinase
VSNGKLVAYYRVSTARQGLSGLGLDAQRRAVTAYLEGREWQLVAEVVEIESGKGSDRPKLQDALRRDRQLRGSWRQDGRSGWPPGGSP